MPLTPEEKLALLAEIPQPDLTPVKRAIVATANRVKKLEAKPAPEKGDKGEPGIGIKGDPGADSVTPGPKGDPGKDGKDADVRILDDLRRYISDTRDEAVVSIKGLAAKLAAFKTPKDGASVLAGDGKPARPANVGDIYIDLESGNVYRFN